MNNQTWQDSLTFCKVTINGFVHHPVYKTPKETKDGRASLYFCAQTLKDPRGERTDKNTLRHRCFVNGDFATHLRGKIRHGDFAYVEGNLAYFMDGGSYIPYVSVFKISLIPSSSHHFQNSLYPKRREDEAKRRKKRPPAHTPY